VNNNKKTKIVVSAINLRSGGTLSIIKDCLSFLDKNFADTFDMIALVHKADAFKDIENIRFIEYPKSIDFYLLRLYYEYYYFYFLSKKIKPYLWLSLHDMSPIVCADVQAVYCHNPSPFYKITFKEVVLDPVFGLFNLFYKWVYKINIKNNDYVIVQQKWMKERFLKNYGIDKEKIIVAHPDVKIKKTKLSLEKSDKKRFIYPTYPRVFKNIEIICEAVNIINNERIKEEYEIIITIDGSENRYSQWLFSKFKNIDNIRFIGLQSRQQIFLLYELVDCLLFPSKLETWGMPISEFKNFNKPIIAADLEYSHETIGKYDKVSFFEVHNVEKLAKLMKYIIIGNNNYDGNMYDNPMPPFVKNWKELFDLLIKGNAKVVER